MEKGGVGGRGVEGLHGEQWSVGHPVYSVAEVSGLVVGTRGGVWMRRHEVMRHHGALAGVMDQGDAVLGVRPGHPPLPGGRPTTLNSKLANSKMPLTPTDKPG